MQAYLLILALFFSAATIAQTISATPVATQTASEWPVKDGSFDIANFRFHDGETLPILHPHYLTLGTLHRNNEGHADNVVLLLHGTGGSAPQKNWCRRCRMRASS